MGRPSNGEGPAVDQPPDATADDGPFFTWYHHALAVGYSASAVVSMSSLPLERVALYGVGSLVGAYLVVAILTVVWRRLVPRLL